MIPLRLMLRGFLCYRDEQEVLLDGSSLWMMAGLNGSGKSAVFDAMTFALFGHHRGGAQNVIELINHDSDRLVVEFDFALDGESYRVKRTATRQVKTNTVRSTQQVFRRTRPDPGGTWEAIETTGNATGFKTWIQEHVGLTYDTFTSSVLLLQGQAEKLLDSKAQGRFAVLAGIVDLDRYRRLHERADTIRKKLKGEVEALQHQLDGLTVVSDEDLAVLEQKVREAESAIQTAENEVGRLFELEQKAQRWGELLNRRNLLERRWKESETTLIEAENIEKDLRRLRELLEVVPRLQLGLEMKTQARNAQAEIEKYTAEERALTEKVKDCEYRIEQTNQTITALHKRRDGAEAQHRDVHVQLRDLSEVVGRVDLCEQQRDRLHKQEAELSSLPQGLESRVGELREEVERLREWQRVLPTALRLGEKRRELRSSREQVAALSVEEAERKQIGAELRSQADERKLRLAEAEKQRQEADGKTVAARTLLDQARAGLKDFLGLSGAQVCRHCGQPLTPGHFEEEKRKREAEVEAAKVTSQKEGMAQKQLLGEETRCRKAVTEAETELQAAREEYTVCKSKLDQSRRDIERLTRECDQAVAELPQAWRERAAGAGADGEPSFPSDIDLGRMRDQVATLEPTRKLLKESETLFVQWQKLRIQIEETRQTLRTLEVALPGDVGALRRKHVQLTTQESTLTAGLKATREEERQATAALDKLNREKNDLYQKRTDVGGKLTTCKSQRLLNLEESDRIRRALPPAWQPALESASLTEINGYHLECQRLKQADTEGKAQRLEQARITLETLKQNRVELEAECAAFPEEARVQPAEVQRQLHTARSVLTTHRAALQECESDRAVLLSKRELREKAQSDFKQKDGEHARYKTLAELLGRERLQLYLVRQAERQVVDHANSVLDRLSGGQLFLRLKGAEEGGNSDSALELEVLNRSTTQAPINVNFLSGSQRFRVAVSLALGLGQYASRQHRPIESVIIDEGFGCLDRQGRQVMIQELQNLRGQLRCILLVSHQEEFADAFSDGYLFALESGATRVKRFQR